MRKGPETDRRTKKLAILPLTLFYLYITSFELKIYSDAKKRREKGKDEKKRRELLLMIAEKAKKMGNHDLASKIFI